MSVLCCTTKYGFIVCVISFVFYSTCYKVYIFLSCINTHRRTVVPFDITHVLSSSDRQTPRLYQVSADCCGGYRNSDVIHLLQTYLKIHYCNQSVLAIVPDLNIVVWSITIFISFRKVPWYITFLLPVIYLYNSTVTKVLQCCFVTRLVSLWSSLSKVIALYCYY